MRIILLLFLSFTTEVTLSQLYTEVSSDLGITHSFINGQYGGGVSFFDVDRDGWDDITLCTNQLGVVYYHNVEGEFAPAQTIVSIPGEIRQAIWIDYDNDGDSDLFVTRYFDSWKLYRNNGTISALDDVTAEVGLGIDLTPQSGGSSWGDIDNDGDLDLYIPNYDFAEGTPTNFFYKNNGDGTFTNATEGSSISDGSQPSFQSLFFDFDKDDDQDLFIVNDRTPHSNTLFRNNDGSFTNETVELGLLQFIFAMNASISDVDHDGDFELYVSNNPFGNSLFSYDSESDFFWDMAEYAGVEVFDHSWSALWLDADNDMWEDLHVAVSPFWDNPGQDNFFFNNGDGTFQFDIAGSGFAGDSTYTHSTAMGDFDHNGFPDVIAVNDFPKTTNIYQNNGNDNHYLKIGLEGVNCNKDAIGARIDMWIGGDLQMRTTHAGEGYFTQNSQYELFGLGPNETVDSLSIIWPGGFTETMYSIEADQFLQIVEGEITESALIVHGAVYNDETNLCNTNEILLVASSPNFVSWNSGGVNDSLTVSTQGEYYYYYFLNDELLTSDTLQIEGVSNYSVAIETTPPTCFGDTNGTISFTHPVDEELDFYTLNDLTSIPLVDLSGGTYEMNFYSVNGCNYSEIIELTQPLELTAVFTVNHAPCVEDVTTVEVDIFGGTSPINTSWSGFDPANTLPGVYTPFVQDANGCVFSDEIEVVEVTEIDIELTVTPVDGEADGAIASNVSGGAGNYTYSWVGPNGFTANTPSIDNLVPGIYTVIVHDQNECSRAESINLTGNSIVEYSVSPKVYPNPANSFVNIESESQIHSIELFTLDGRLVSATYAKNESGQYQIDLQSLPSGVLFIRIYNANDAFTKRIVVEH